MKGQCNHFCKIRLTRLTNNSERKRHILIYTFMDHLTTWVTILHNNNLGVIKTRKKWQTELGYAK